jgi:integrase
MQHHASASAQPRRVKVKDRRGIYYRAGRDGRRRYEITFRDSEGRQRWKVVPGGLKDAEAALGEVRARMRRGERVAPARVSFAEVADMWQATLGELRPRTREDYARALRVHVLPRFGRMRASEITEDHVATFIGEMRDRGYAGWTIRAQLTPLGRALSWAARRGIIGTNPLTRLERGERPSVERTEMRILSRDEIAAMLAAADVSSRPLLATAVFTGARLGELLGLTWANVDFDAGALRIRRQLDRGGERVDVKTRQAVREIILMPGLGRLLREHRLRSPFSADGDLVFPSRTGAGLDRTVARGALARAMRSARLDGVDKPRLRFHDLRHTFASLLVAQGENVVFVSRQLGHASPDITLKVYAHLFDAAEHAERASAALQESFGNVLETNGGEEWRSGGPAIGSLVPFQSAPAAGGD